MSSTQPTRTYTSSVSSIKTRWLQRIAEGHDMHTTEWLQRAMEGHDHDHAHTRTSSVSSITTKWLQRTAEGALRPAGLRSSRPPKVAPGCRGVSKGACAQGANDRGQKNTFSLRDRYIKDSHPKAPMSGPRLQGCVQRGLSASDCTRAAPQNVVPRLRGCAPGAYVQAIAQK
eukprot:scaffold101651_cov21-Tisochrysis_lutea.AAC.2